MIYLLILVIVIFCLKKPKACLFQQSVSICSKVFSILVKSFLWLSRSSNAATRRFKFTLQSEYFAIELIDFWRLSSMIFWTCWTKLVCSNAIRALLVLFTFYNKNLAIIIFYLFEIFKNNSNTKCTLYL